MKFIAYLLIAANVALGAFYFSTQTEKDTSAQKNVTATLSNLSTKTKTNNVAAVKPVKEVAVKPVIEQKVIEKPIPVAVVPPVIEKPIVEEILSCIQISQILEESTAIDIQTTLLENQIDNNLKQKDIVVKTVYSILVGPFSSSNRTKLEIQSLKKDKIDYYVLPDGENKGAISLGLYSNKKGAQGEVTKFLAKDYDVHLEEKDIYKTQYFIDIPAKSSEKLTSDVWNSILKGHSAIKKVKKDC